MSADRPAFLRGIPINEMTDAEAAAYWKHQAHRHEQRHKKLLAELRRIGLTFTPPTTGEPR